MKHENEGWRAGGGGGVRIMPLIGVDKTGNDRLLNLSVGVESRPARPLITLWMVSAAFPLYWHNPAWPLRQLASQGPNPCKTPLPDPYPSHSLCPPLTPLSKANRTCSESTYNWKMVTGRFVPLFVMASRYLRTLWTVTAQSEWGCVSSPMSQNGHGLVAGDKSDSNIGTICFARLLYSLLPSL